MGIINADGKINGGSVDSTNYGVVPVINLTAEAVQDFTGTGTKSDPFIINGESGNNDPLPELTSTDVLNVLKSYNSNIQVNSGTPNFANTATSNEGLYSANDDYGTSYYWRGDSTTNYIKFANLYWRYTKRL